MLILSYYLLQTNATLDFASFYQDDFLADFILKSSDGEEFKAHRFVLVKRSDVFDAMLRTDMEEKNSNVIELSEVSRELKLFLRMLYNQEIRGSYKDFMDLALMCSKYLMTKEHNECIVRLLLALDSNNAVELWLFASRNNFEGLKGQSFEYVTKYDISFTFIIYNSIKFEYLFELLYSFRNLKAIRESGGWDLLMEHPEFLDKAIGGYIEHVENEKKQLQKKPKSPEFAFKPLLYDFNSYAKS